MISTAGRITNGVTAPCGSRLTAALCLDCLSLAVLGFAGRWGKGVFMMSNISGAARNRGASAARPCALIATIYR